MFKKVVESRFEPKPMFHYSHMVAFMFALPKLTTGNSGFSLISIPLLLAVVHWLSKSWIGLVLCHLQTFALATFLIAWVASSCGLRLQMTWVSGLNGVRKEEGFIHQLTFSIGQRLTPWDIIALSPYISHSRSDATPLQRRVQSSRQHVALPFLQLPCVFFVLPFKHFSPSTEINTPSIL